MVGTPYIIIAAFAVRSLPASVRAGVAALQQIDPSIEEASNSLGADAQYTFRKVTLPLITPALLAGLIFSFTRHMTSLSAIIFLVSPRWRIVTASILSEWEQGGISFAAAYASVIIVLVLIAIGLLYFVTNRVFEGRGDVDLTWALRSINGGMHVPGARKCRIKSLPARGGAGEVTAVDDVSLEIEKGEFVTLLGPSGCGKTTTLRMIAGFEFPTAGDISLDGKAINDLPPHKRDMSMVFQSYAIFPHLTVFENIAYGLKVQRLPKDEIQKRVERVLELVELTGSENRAPNQLSGGQQQRVALARALVMEPKVLLMDEPLSNLDAKLREQMRTEIRRIQQQFGITSVYVTHDQIEAMTLSDRIVVMNEGDHRAGRHADRSLPPPQQPFCGRFHRPGEFCIWCRAQRKRRISGG